MTFLRVWAEHYPTITGVVNNFGLFTLSCGDVSFFESGDAVFLNGMNTVASIVGVNYTEGTIEVFAPYVSEITSCFYREMFIFWNPPTAGSFERLALNDLQQNDAGQLIPNMQDPNNLHYTRWTVPVTLLQLRDKPKDRTVVDLIDFIIKFRNKPLTVDFVDGDSSFRHLLRSAHLANTNAQLLGAKGNEYNAELIFIGIDELGE